MKKLWKSNTINFEEKYLKDESNSIVITKCYGLCRHPQQSATLIIFLSAGLSWSFGRMLYIIVMAIGVIIGVN